MYLIDSIYHYKISLINKDISGALSMQDAIKVIYCRSKLQQHAAEKQRGNMIATNLKLEEAESMLFNLFIYIVCSHCNMTQCYCIPLI